MDTVITKAATIACQHQGPVTPITAAVSTVLSVDGVAVLFDRLNGSTVDSTKCTQQPTPTAPNNVACATVQAQTSGLSTVLKCEGKPVLLEKSGGTTNGLPTNNWSTSDAGQTMLTAD